MEGIIIVITFFGGIWLLGIIFSKIGELINDRREKIRDEVAKEVLNGRDIEVEIKKYKKRLKYIDYQRENISQQMFRWYNTKAIGESGDFLGSCPKCNKGYSVVRIGKYGKFIGCSDYPDCRYIKNIKHAKKEYNEIVNEQIIDEIKKTYL